MANFFSFFLIFFSAIAERAKKGDHAAQISWQRQREKSPGVVVIRCAVKNGCDHRRSSAAATLPQLWGEQHGASFPEFAEASATACASVWEGMVAMTQPGGQLCHGERAVSVRRRAA